jgi:hypothetical protein
MTRRGLPFSAVVLAALCVLVFSSGTVAQEASQTLQYSQTPDKYQGREYSLVRIVRLSLVEGNVQINRIEEPGWEAAQLNLPLRQGYALATGQGRAEVEFESGATARLAEDSSLEFRELALLDGGRLTQMFLSQGTASFYANLSAEDSFVVTTPHLIAQVSRNARFRLDVTSEGTSVGVIKGEVNVEALGNAYRVTKNRALIFRTADEQILLAKLGEGDAWDRWVADREEVLVASRDRTGRYMNTSGYRYGLSDFDRYGSWYNISGYGWAWQPWGISASWMPYSVGYWHYIYGIGWGWHSYEPWGWMPYHFGSWIHVGNRGWCWVPGHFNRWHPGRVYYVWHNNRHSWGPLAPHDRPGQRPANLPHGTVSPGVPTGRIGPGRVTRADLRDEDGIGVSFEQPRGFGGAVRPTRGPTRAESPARPIVPASGFAGTMPSAPTRGISPEDRADLPRGTQHPRATAPAGIVYDPTTGRYINGSATSSRPSAVTPVAPSGYSGEDRAAKPSQRMPPGIDRRPSDDTPSPSARPSNPRWGSAPSSTASPSQNPRSESPRVNTPRNDSPRYESPRSSSQPSNQNSGGWGSRPSSPPPSSPPPRVEGPRPSSPPPSGGGWGGRPSSPPPPPPRTNTGNTASRPGRPGGN